LAFVLPFPLFIVPVAQCISGCLILMQIAVTNKDRIEKYNKKKPELLVAIAIAIAIDSGQFWQSK
jgi:hypothetical protein